MQLSCKKDIIRLPVYSISSILSYFGILLDMVITSYPAARYGLERQEKAVTERDRGSTVVDVAGAK